MATIILSLVLTALVLAAGLAWKWLDRGQSSGRPEPRRQRRRRYTDDDDDNWEQSSQKSRGGLQGTVWDFGMDPRMHDFTSKLREEGERELGRGRRKR